MTPRREMAVTVGVLALAAGVVLMAAGQPRVTAGSGSSMTGADTPAATALALVALAGAGALLLVRGWARVVIGGLLVAVGVGMVLAMQQSPDDIRWFTYGPAEPRIRQSAWGWLGLVGGVLVSAAAVVTTWRARGWPQPRRGFDAPAGAAAPAAGVADRPRDAWDALDRGEDPTA